MLLDQILIMCLLLIGSHGNMCPDSKITCSKAPSDAVSLPRGTHPNAGQGVNQAQTHSGLDSRLQALVSLIIIETSLTIVFLYVHCEWYEIHAIHAHACKLKIHVSPLSNQKTQNLGKLREIHHPFSNSDHGKWNSQNLQQIVQNLLNLPTVTTNHAKFMQFAPIFQCSLYPRAELSNFAIFVYLCNFVDFSF